MDFDALRFVRFLNGDMAEGYEEPMWVTEREKLEAKREGRDCIDMYVLLKNHSELISSFQYRTEHRDFGTNTYTSLTTASQSRTIYHPPNSTFVSKVLPLLSSDEQKANLETFTSFYTRYYNSDTGRASSRWLYQRAVNYTEKYASSELKTAARVELVLVPHNFKQESVVCSGILLICSFPSLIAPILNDILRLSASIPRTSPAQTL